MNLAQLLEGLEAFTLGLFTRVLNWSPDEVQVFLSKVWFCGLIVR